MQKYKFQFHIDHPQRTLEHREIILKKPMLRKLYEDWYSNFQKVIAEKDGGKFVEIGSGGGFLKELEPSVICSDYLDLPTNDMTFSALEMPFDDNSIDGIFMIDTFHHIPDSQLCLTEVNRVLKKNGTLMMVEPANSLWGRFIYQNFHHEPFDPKGDWTIPSQGPMSGANGALPYIVFKRDETKFESLFPNLRLLPIKYMNPLRYLLSGGVSFRKLVPSFLIPLVNGVDNLLPQLWENMSMFQLIEVKKK